jgi:hypothetical protein
LNRRGASILHDSHFDFLKGIFDNADQHHDLISQKQELVNQLHELGIDLDMGNISDADLKDAIHEAIGINTFEHGKSAGAWMCLMPSLQTG